MVFPIKWTFFHILADYVLTESAKSSAGSTAEPLSVVMEVIFHCFHGHGSKKFFFHFWMIFKLYLIFQHGTTIATETKQYTSIKTVVLWYYLQMIWWFMLTSFMFKVNNSNKSRKRTT